MAPVPQGLITVIIPRYTKAKEGTLPSGGYPIYRVWPAPDDIYRE